MEKVHLWSTGPVSYTHLDVYKRQTFGINIKPFDWLDIAGRFGYDTYKTDGYTRYDSMSYYLTRAQKGQQDNYYRSYYGYNHTITATARQKFGKFSTRLMVGNMWQDYETRMFSVVGTNLQSFSRSDSNNTDPTTRLRLSNACLLYTSISAAEKARYHDACASWYDSCLLYTSRCV